MIYRLFHCPKCKTKIMFPKKKKSERGHRKSAYCGICKETVSWIMDDY